MSTPGTGDPCPAPLRHPHPFPCGCILAKKFGAKINLSQPQRGTGPLPGVPRHPPSLTLVGGVGAGGGAGGCGVRVPARQELGVARVRPVRDGRSQAERWGQGGWHGARGHGAAVPIPGVSRARGPPPGAYPLCAHSRISAVQELSCCSSPASNSTSVALVTWGTPERDTGTLERDLQPYSPPTHTTHAWGPDRAEHPHPAGCVPAIPGMEEEPKFGTGASSSTCAPKGWGRRRGQLRGPSMGAVP